MEIRRLQQIHLNNLVHSAPFSGFCFLDCYFSGEFSEGEREEGRWMCLFLIVGAEVEESTPPIFGLVEMYPTYVEVM